MLVHKTEKQLKEVTVKYYHLCDKCNKKIEADDSFDAFEFTLELKTGTSYPEGGSGKLDEIHLCKEHALELIQILKGKDYRVNHSEWDY